VDIVGAFPVGDRNETSVCVRASGTVRRASGGHTSGGCPAEPGGDVTDQPPYDRPEQGGPPVGGDPGTGGWSDPGQQPPPPSGWPGGGGDDWGQQRSAPSNGMGVAALVVGILAVLAILIFPVAILLGIVAVVLGVLGRKRAARLEATNRGQATAGMVLGIVAVLLGIAIGIAFGSLIASNSEEIGDLADCVSDATTEAERNDCEERFASEIGAG
jgi:hypothetical protein